MIEIQHPYVGKMRLTKEERLLASRIKQAARHKVPSLMNWYIAQLAELLEEQDREEVS